MAVGMRKLSLVILAATLGVWCLAPGYAEAGTNPRNPDRDARKMEKKQQKAQKKAERKMLKESKKKTHYPTHTI